VSAGGGLLRAGLVGAASGSRSTIGLAAVALTERGGGVLGRSRVRVVVVAAAAIELVLDKLPRTPSRLRPAGLVPRIVFGAVAAGALHRRGQAGVDSGTAACGTAGAVLVAAAGAGAAAFAGAGWRRWAATRRGSDRWGALAEDLVSAMSALGATFVP
jgi:uncharacterized membrane protein